MNPDPRICCAVCGSTDPVNLRDGWRLSGTVAYCFPCWRRQIMEFIEGFSEGAGTDEPCTAWAQAAKGLSINEQVLLEMGGYDEGYNQGSLWKEK